MWKWRAALIANHFLCDFNKDYKTHSKNTKPKVISLSSKSKLLQQYLMILIMIKFFHIN